MGKGNKPEFAIFDGEKLGYIQARKKIYAPLYAEAVQKTESFRLLQEMYEAGETLWIRDWDGRDTKGESLTDTLNNPKKIFGHGFVLAILLTNDPAVEQFVF